MSNVEMSLASLADGIALMGAAQDRQTDALARMQAGVARMSEMTAQMIAMVEGQLTDGDRA